MDTTIQKVKDNDEAVITKLYNETVNKAYFVAKRLIKDEDTIMDILQDSYVTAYQKIEQLDKIENFGKWLDTIVINKAKDYLKKKKEILFADLRDADGEEFEIQEESKDFKPEETIDYAETKRLVMAIIDELPAEQRMCVLLYYYKEMSVGEISETIGCSTGTVKSRLNYARKTIKTKVEELEKKGTKLYTISIFPFLYWLFKEEAETTTAGNAAALCEKVIQGYSTGQVVAQEMASKSTSAVAKGTAGTAANTGMTLGTKLIIGTVIVGVLGGGGYAVAHNLQPKQEETVVVAETQTENIVPDTETEEITATEEVMTETETEKTGYVLDTDALEAYRDLLIHPENYGLTTTINGGEPIPAQDLAIAFCDLNKDGIPEAIVDNCNANVCNADMCQSLYSIVDGKPQFIDYVGDAYGGCYISKDGYLTDEEWHMGVSITSYGYDATNHQIEIVLDFDAEAVYDDSINDYQILDGTVYCGGNFNSNISSQSTQQLSAEEAQALYNQYCSDNNKACDLQRVNFGDIDWSTEDLTKYTTYTQYM